MFSLKKLLVEAPDFEVYHKSYTDAVNTALEYLEKRGFEYDKEDAFNKIGMNTKKPSAGKTTRFSLPLYKNGKEQRKQLHVQVYGMEGGKYELNAYIN